MVAALAAVVLVVSDASMLSFVPRTELPLAPLTSASLISTMIVLPVGAVIKCAPSY